jgi:hypothetical protein
VSCLSLLPDSGLVSLWAHDIISVDLQLVQGAVESVSVGEIKLSLRQSLVKLGVGFISRDPKLQVLICDLEVVMRPSNKSPGKKKTRKSRASGRGKWMIVGNIARYLSVCVTDLVLKVSP